MMLAFALGDQEHHQRVIWLLEVPVLVGIRLPNAVGSWCSLAIVA
jgi:hypothetical protein